MRTKKVIRENEMSWTFPGLLCPVRKKAANNNQKTLLRTVLKHSAVLLGTFVGIFLVRLMTQ